MPVSSVAPAPVLSQERGSRAPARLASPGAPAAPEGPFPLVVFSHGSGVSSPVGYELLLNAWAAAGYVIAATQYPLSSTSLPNASEDAVNQPADVSFLISEMVRLGADRASPYAGPSTASGSRSRATHP